MTWWTKEDVENYRRQVAPEYTTNAAPECCDGEPRTSSTCEKCGCVEGGNGSFTCAQHQKEQRDRRAEERQTLPPYIA